jgi:uncharacterized Ntn-hydrolase superfamily protein
MLILSAVALALTLTACSTVSTHVNKGTVKANSFSFVNQVRKTGPETDERTLQGLAMIRQALATGLAAKGVGEVPSGGDVTVAFLVIVGNNVSTVALDSYFGYSDDSDKLLSAVHSSEAVGGDKRGYFEAGTLVVDFVDPHTSKVLQRRTIHADVLRDISMEKRAERIQAIVNQALQDVPLAK